MKILVLDTIHGGQVLADRLEMQGNEVDAVDVYRGESGISVGEARSRRYDLVVAPVHLDPDHPLLHLPATPAITHHDAVRLLLGDGAPRPMIEITGARGKTTTARALASLPPGRGVLHTSSGTWACPEKWLLAKESITPASTLKAAALAGNGGWLITEISLGVSGAGDVGVLTSGDDYRIAAGKKSALAEKLRSLAGCRTVVVAPGVELSGRNIVRTDEVVACTGDRLRYAYGGLEGEFRNPLALLEGYRIPLMVAAAVACVLSLDPAPLAAFAALSGRMQTRTENGILIVDNANSGTTAATTIEAANYARRHAGSEALTLVIGREAKNICEGFPDDQIEKAVREVGPDRLVLVGAGAVPPSPAPVHHADDLAQGLGIAQEITATGSIVLAVKTWR